jgi:hypothetical protein
MNRLERFACATAAMALLSLPLAAQSVISANAGTLHHSEGEVYLNGSAVERKFGKFAEIKAGQTLRTAEGRAEVLLTPGVFVRLGENSEMKMLSTRLSDTRVELLSGLAVIECAEILEGNAVTLVSRGHEIEFPKPGLFWMDGATGVLRVYDGQALVALDKQTATVKEGREFALNGMFLPAQKFDKKDSDSLYRWAKRRAGYISMANISAAKKLSDSDMSFSRAMWVFNPWLGLMTYMPYRGIYNSPFGYRFWSPVTVHRFYEAAYYRPSPMAPTFPSAASASPRWNPNLGYHTTTQRSAGGYSAPVQSSAPAAAASAPAPSVRSGDSAAPRGGGGGRGR